MSIQTNLQGRLRNTALPASNGMLPVYEAVSNAIHAIEDAKIQNGEITVQINRNGQATLNYEHESKRGVQDAKGEIIGFTITDNGIGFNEDNMKSFLTLDSQYKTERGGRGVGRLLWLKAFERATVESVYQDGENGKKKRTFTFNDKHGVSKQVSEEVGKSEPHRTQICLNGFKQKFRAAAPKKARAIANHLLEHCLWYFVRHGGAPTIKVVDDDDTINLDHVYQEQMVDAAANEFIELKGKKFDLIHIKISASSGRSHNIAYCASNRLVTQESLKGKIPGLFGNLRDGEITFVYECYVSSPVLDERVRAERTSFDIDEEPTMFDSKDVSQKDIREAVIGRATAFLSTYLEEKRRLSEERVTKFVAQKAPRYRPILPRIPKDRIVVDPDISDKELDLVLHKELAEIESQLLSEGHDVLQPQPQESFPDYKARVSKYVQKAEDIKRSDLAAYVTHRRVIIDLLASAIRRQDDGNYAREDLIHTLIMPMRKDSNETHFETCNLWLLDERLAFHDYLASDKPLSSSPITGATETKEPDILALNVFDNPMLVSEGQNLPPAALIVVELKRPMRNDASQGEQKDPIEQALGYLDRIRQGKVQTANGRLIPGSENIPGFCYVLCDLTQTVVQRCKIHDAIRTSDGLGYFFYNKSYGAYVEVISFDRLVNAAKERNKAFFDKLGLPTT
jgi:hypothetical protein